MTNQNFFKRSFRHNVFISACGEWKVVRSTTKTKEPTYSKVQNQWALYNLSDDDGEWQYIQTFPNMTEIKSHIKINKKVYT